jgi:hypothetical protein
MILPSLASFHPPPMAYMKRAALTSMVVARHRLAVMIGVRAAGTRAMHGVSMLTATALTPRGRKDSATNHGSWVVRIALGAIRRRLEMVVRPADRDVACKCARTDTATSKPPYPPPHPTPPRASRAPANSPDIDAVSYVGGTIENAVAHDVTLHWWIPSAAPNGATCRPVCPSNLPCRSRLRFRTIQTCHFDIRISSVTESIAPALRCRILLDADRVLPVSCAICIFAFNCGDSGKRSSAMRTIVSRPIRQGTFRVGLAT